MEDNARVVWHVSLEPWILEHQLIRCSDLPLNLNQNRHHAFHAQLTELRRAAKLRARAQPVL